jgi:hypothetical protein
VSQTKPSLTLLVSCLWLTARPYQQEQNTLQKEDTFAALLLEREDVARQ